MFVTLFGIVTDSNLEQLENIEFPMVVEPCATAALVMDLSTDPNIDQILNLPGTTTILIPEQKSNASLAMFVTLFGIVTDISPEQP